jgi:uncharacterized membrane protein YdbT with pleckstrin-like domain
MEKKDIHLLSDEDDTLSDKENEFVSEGIIINEVQLLLAEKRTSLATMRTGITVFVLPLSVLSVLIATSKYYDITQVMPFIVPLLAICVLLVLLGSYLIIRSVIKMRHQDSLIMQLKRKHHWIAEYID